MKNATYFKLLSIISFVSFCIMVTLSAVIRNTQVGEEPLLFLLLLIVFGGVGVWLEARGNKAASGSRRKREKDADDTE